MAAIALATGTSFSHAFSPPATPFAFTNANSAASDANIPGKGGPRRPPMVYERSDALFAQHALKQHPAFGWLNNRVRRDSASTAPTPTTSSTTLSQALFGSLGLGRHRLSPSPLIRNKERRRLKRSSEHKRRHSGRHQEKHRRRHLRRQSLTTDHQPKAAAADDDDNDSGDNGNNGQSRLPVETPTFNPRSNSMASPATVAVRNQQPRSKRQSDSVTTGESTKDCTLLLNSEYKSAPRWLQVSSGSRVSISYYDLIKTLFTVTMVVPGTTGHMTVRVKSSNKTICVEDGKLVGKDNGAGDQCQFVLPAQMRLLNTKRVKYSDRIALLINKDKSSYYYFAPSGRENQLEQYSIDKSQLNKMLSRTILNESSLATTKQLESVYAFKCKESYNTFYPPKPEPWPPSFASVSDIPLNIKTFRQSKLSANKIRQNMLRRRNRLGMRRHRTR